MRLSRLEMEEGAEAEFIKKLESVLNMIETDFAQINDQIKDLRPMTSCHEYLAFMREDITQDTDVNNIFANANEKSKAMKCFIVPQVI